tara:strand:- start:187 stop:477 length:291 start_codon:yes stop_codon:yes gene_type:complete
MLYDTIEKRRKFVSTRGNIITFKEKQEVIFKRVAVQEFPSFVGKLGFTSQILINKIINEDNNFQIFNVFGQGSEPCESVDEMIENVDWEFMEESHG